MHITFAGISDYGDSWQQNTIGEAARRKAHASSPPKVKAGKNVKQTQCKYQLQDQSTQRWAFAPHLGSYTQPEERALPFQRLLLMYFDKRVAV
jgi:hypothetical protein